MIDLHLRVASFLLPKVILQGRERERKRERAMHPFVLPWWRISIGSERGSVTAIPCAADHPPQRAGAQIRGVLGVPWKKHAEAENDLQGGFPHHLDCHQQQQQQHQQHNQQQHNPGLFCPPPAPPPPTGLPAPQTPPQLLQSNLNSPGSLQGQLSFDGQLCDCDTIDFYSLSIKVLLEERKPGERMMSRDSRL